ncbi:hypothetical protein [Vitreimonas flagellata]|uniref:hypothetical protein n=1 Tax=Vitreimonas flagellata TaxID=2560861 RepID=UPI0010756CD4|nr:hypothetical protein [Vitreimonas flagellata]
MTSGDRAPSVQDSRLRCSFGAATNRVMPPDIDLLATRALVIEVGVNTTAKCVISPRPASIFSRRLSPGCAASLEG